MGLLLLLPQAQVPKGTIKFGFCGSGGGVGCEHFCGGFYFFFRDFVVLLMKMSRVLCGRPLVGMNKFCFVFGMKFFPLLC